MTEPLGQFKRKHGKGLTASTRHSPRSTAIPGPPSHLLLDDVRATGWASCCDGLWWTVDPALSVDVLSPWLAEVNH
jgi:hypothetical protein